MGGVHLLGCDQWSSPCPKNYTAFVEASQMLLINTVRTVHKVSGEQPGKNPAMQENQCTTSYHNNSHLLQLRLLHAWIEIECTRYLRVGGPGHPPPTGFCECQKTRNGPNCLSEVVSTRIQGRGHVVTPLYLRSSCCLLRYTWQSGCHSGCPNFSRSHLAYIGTAWSPTYQVSYRK